MNDNDKKKIKKLEDTFYKYKSISEKLINHLNITIARQKKAIELLVGDLKKQDDNYQFSVVR